MRKRDRAKKRWCHQDGVRQEKEKKEEGKCSVNAMRKKEEKERGVVVKQASSTLEHA